MSSVYFATGNKHKFKEAEEMLAKHKISLKRFDFKHNEIRSDSLEEIATEAVAAAYKKLKKPVFVEDTGLFIKSLNGFPGTYSRWALEKIGCKGILRLMQGRKNRTAEFRACIAFKNGKVIKTFLGVCKGEIAKKQYGKSGFGYDSLFVPKGKKMTFAQDPQTKSNLSHRAKALKKLTLFLRKTSIKKLNHQ